MNDIKFSPFMEKVIARATELAKIRGDKIATEEDIFAVAMSDVIYAREGDISKDIFMGGEFEALDLFLESVGKDARIRLMDVVELVSSKPVNPFDSSSQFNSLISRAASIAQRNGSSYITADIVINCILDNPTELINSFVTGKKLAVSEKANNADTSVKDEQGNVIKGNSAHADADFVFNTKASASDVAAKSGCSTEKEPKSPDLNRAYLTKELEKLKEIRQKLLERVFGQDHAVNSVIQGLFKAAIADVTEKDRRRPRAAFLFAGPPGVGKTFIAEQLREHLGYDKEDYKRFDMSDYSDEDSMVGLFGSDGVYKDSQPGLLTRFVEEHPKCIILFDEVEKAHLKVIHQFLQILDAGHCLDQKIKKYVSFRDTIIIFTTNAGRPLYENSEQTSYGDVSAKVILNALKKDIDPNTKEPFFPAAICSRFATGNVIMFNHMQAHDLINLARKNIVEHIDAVKDSFGYSITVDEKLYPTVLFAEGGLADARSVSSRSKTFFDNELFELLRLIETEETEHTISEIESISIQVKLPQDKPKIKALYEPEHTGELLVVADEQLSSMIKSATDSFVVHTASGYDEAVSVIKEKNISAVLCDFYFGEVQGSVTYLNAEDIDTDGRALFRYVSKETDIPVFVIENPLNSLCIEERLSLNREGARGVIENITDVYSLGEQLASIGRQIHYHHALKELARANKILKFSTGQTVSVDGKSAVITLFDFYLDVAVDAEDQESIMSKMSKPDTKFSDVIGAQDAKKELQFFIDSLKNPRKYASSGVKSPRGILLYGPPGTGKTLLAKATAGESDVTFISQEGNDFLKGGEAGKRAVHDLFALARKYAPSIIFIDEIDAIAKARTGYSDPDREATLTAFLTEMDGFKTDASKPVFVLAATNFEVEEGSAKSLDSAFMRRFDRRIYIGLPSKENREEHLRIKISKNPMYEISEDTIKNIAVRSMGQSLANLDSVLELSLRTALRDGKRKVTDEILDEAFETFNSGESTKYNDETILRIARHEAGHTLLCYESGETPSYVTIVSRGSHGGYMMHDDKEDQPISTREDILSRIRTSLGGRAAEIIYYGKDAGVSTGPSSDLKNATALAMHMVCSWGMCDSFGLSVVDTSKVDMTSLGDDVRKAVNDILESEFNNAVRIITDNKAKLDALVDALIEHSQLNGAEITEIFESAE